MRRGDATALADCYDEAAVVVPQTGKICRGRASIRRLFSRWLATTAVREFEVETEDLRVLDGAAVEVGRYRMVVSVGGSDPVSDDGKFLVVYARAVDGTWRIVRDMSSSNRT